MKKINQMTHELAVQLLEEAGFYQKDREYSYETIKMQLDNSEEIFTEDLCVNDPSEINKQEGDYFNVYTFADDYGNCINIIYDEDYVYSAVLIEDLSTTYHKF